MIKKMIFLGFFLFSSVFAATDPTMPANWSADSVLSKAPKNIVFSGVFVKYGHAVAVINGKDVETGDFVAGYLVKQIKPDRIYLKSSHGVIVVPLFSKVKTVTTEGLH